MAIYLFYSMDGGSSPVTDTFFSFFLDLFCYLSDKSVTSKSSSGLICSICSV